eukprot:m.109807 g.109807  ORF g.109807 m.109807 type:complete len:60 (-) comp9210_c2_seq1:111-290(-)
MIKPIEQTKQNKINQFTSCVVVDHACVIVIMLTIIHNSVKQWGTNEQAREETKENKSKT